MRPSLVAAILTSVRAAGTICCRIDWFFGDDCREAPPGSCVLVNRHGDKPPLAERDPSVSGPRGLRVPLAVAVRNVSLAVLQNVCHRIGLIHIFKRQPYCLTTIHCLRFLVGFIASAAVARHSLCEYRQPTGCVRCVFQLLNTISCKENFPCCKPNHRN